MSMVDRTDRSKKHSSAALITAVTAYLDPLKKDVSFDQLRAKVPALAGKPDGTVHQAVLDAGFKVIA